MKTLKRITAWIVVLSLLCSALMFSAFAKANSEFTVVTDKNSVETGDTVTFTIHLNHTDGRKLLYTEMYLNYNAENLTFVQADAVEENTEIDISEVTNITEGSSAVFYEFSAMDVDNGIVIADGIEFFSVQFRVIGTDNWEAPQLEVISFLEIDMESEIPFEINQATCEVKHTCVFNQELTKSTALKSAADCENAAVYYKSCTCGAISTTETFIYGTANGHTPAGWDKNDDEHWQNCSVCFEEITTTRAAHNDDDMDDFCDDCGYNMHVCVFDQEDALMDALKSEADCNNAAMYYKSCLCGAISTTETFTYGSANGHTETDWQKSNDEHWKVCGVCTEEIANSRGNHADKDGDYTCDACGYDMTPAQPEHPVCMFDQEVVKAEALKTAADCENAAVYYKSCTCGAISTTEIFTYGTANGHAESDWQKSETNHWKYCTVCTEEIENSRGTHADNDGDNTCDICGYDMTPVQPEHPVCVFDQEVVKAEALETAADCKNAAVYYKSCACGAISTTETFTYGTANGHTESDWQKSTTDHWKVCTVCTEEIVNSRGMHADTDSDYACDTCGYDMTPAQPGEPEHTCTFDQNVVKIEALKTAADCENAAVYYKSCTCGAISNTETFTYGSAAGHIPSAWVYNNTRHWQICTECRETLTASVGNHTDYNNDNYCDTCGYRYENNDSFWPGFSTMLPVAAPQMPFADVSRSDWFYDDVRNAWENDLIDGVTATSFRPYETLTVAQAIKLAAALHQLDNMGYVTLSNGYTNWYDTYVDYAVENGIIENKYASYTADQINAPISRNEFVHIFYGAMNYYSQWNSVADNAIPDVKLGDKYASEIYTFYRAGILTGNDAAGTFAPNSSIKRSEVAAILSRMYDESCRQSITLN